MPYSPTWSLISDLIHLKTIASMLLEEGKIAIANDAWAVMTELKTLLTSMCSISLLHRSESVLIPFTWQAIKMIGTSIKIIRKDSMAPENDSIENLLRFVKTNQQLQDKIIALNRLRFLFADLYRKNLDNATATYTGSRFYDSDIDITVSIEAVHVDPTEVLYYMIDIVFPYAKQDASVLSVLLDINVYIANFEVSKTIDCFKTSNAKQNVTQALDFGSAPNVQRSHGFTHTRHGMIGRMTTSKALIKPGEYRPYGYYRVWHMFDENSNIAKLFTQLDKTYSAYSYSQAASEYHHAVCHSTDLTHINELLFIAMTKSRDQYYSLAAYELVVLHLTTHTITEEDIRAEYLSKKDKTPLLRDAAWDNFGMLYHVLESDECTEINWLSKCCKYMSRISRWRVSGHKYVDVSDIDFAKMRLATTTTVASFLEAMKSYNHEVPSAYQLAYTKLLNHSAFATEEKKSVLKACFNYMMKWFNPFTEDNRDWVIPIGGGGRSVRLSNALRKAFDVPRKMKGEKGLEYIAKKYTKQDILQSVASKLNVQRAALSTIRSKLDLIYFVNAISSKKQQRSTATKN